MQSVMISGLSIFLVMLRLSAEARQWTDASGAYRVEADLVAVSDDSAILKSKDNRLLVVKREQLSEADRLYLQGTEATAAMRPYAEVEQTWTMSNGLRLVGRVLQYGARDITIQRQRGDIHIDGIEYEKLGPEYQRMLPAIVSHFEGIELKDEVAFRQWVRNLSGQSRTYHIEGVIMKLSSGLELRIPLFLFAEYERSLIEPGLAQYKARKAEEAAQQQLAMAEQERKLAEEQRVLAEQRESLMLQSLANAYHVEQAKNRQLQMMQLELQAVNAGLTDLWEVVLYPANGYGYPTAVVVSARNSLAAQQQALQRYPGAVVGPTRKVAGY